MLQIGVSATKESWRDNYITPLEIIDSINRFADAINSPGFFDPCPQNPQEDGLLLNWSNKSQNLVYINPPFSKYASWLHKGLEYINKVDMIFVCNTACETKWYRKALSYANVELRTNFRIKFIDPRTKEPAENPRCSNTFFYFGKNKMEFIKKFSKYGVGLDLDLWRVNISQIFPNFMEF